MSEDFHTDLEVILFGLVLGLSVAIFFMMIKIADLNEVVNQCSKFGA